MRCWEKAERVRGRRERPQVKRTKARRSSGPMARSTSQSHCTWASLALHPRSYSVADCNKSTE